MTLNGWLQLILYFVVLLVLAKPLGAFMARVYEGQSTWLDRIIGPIERLIYRLSGVNPQAEMNWKTYALAMLLFNLFGLIVVYLLQRVQGALPLNPQGLGAVSPDSSFNTAVSFATNTNWQGYGGETTMSYLTQMLGLTVQNFVSAATGMAVLVALIRGLRARSAQTIGNFWVDLVRTTLYILLPLSIVLAVVLVSQGVIQNFNAYQPVTLLQADDRMPMAMPSRSKCCRWGRRRRKSRSSSWAPTAAGSSTSTRRIRLRIHAAVELPGTAGDPADPGGAVLHVRRDGGRYAPGLGLLAAMTIVFAAMTAVCRWRRAERQSRPSRRWASIRRRASCKPAATWKAKRCASASSIRRCGPRPRRPPRTAASIRCTIRSRRWAAWCRCG